MDQAQDTMESGEVQVVTENKKSGPMCYSMYEWALRLSLCDKILGVGMAFLFFYLPSMVEDYQVAQTTGLLLLVGLASKKLKVLLRVYYWYASILAVIVCLLFFLMAIFTMVYSGEIGLGFLVILLGVVLSGYMLYIGCVIYSICMNIIQNKEEINLKKSDC